MSGKFHRLLQHCADLGIMVEYAGLGRRHGEYRHDESLIRLNNRNTGAQDLAALAHEFGHALCCEHGENANHDRADEIGAAVVIEDDEYAAAERLVGCHPGALAAHLDVTPRLVLAWRRWYERKRGPVLRFSDEHP